MQVALMIPCYIDLFYPEVGVATLELLEKLKVDVVYPLTRLAALSRWRIADVMRRHKRQKNCSSKTFRPSITS